MRKERPAEAGEYIGKLAKAGVYTLLGTGCLVVYLLTLAPSLTWAHWGADGGDFVAAAVGARMPHPPGFPLYLALSQMMVRLPARDPAWRLNVLSAIMATGTVILTALTLRLRKASPWVACVTALTLAFAPLFWSQALIAEVYTSAAFFVALALYFLARGRRNNRGEWFAVGVAWGMAVAVHATLVLLVPLWLAQIVSRQGKWSRALLRMALGFGVGVLPYVLLPLLGGWPQPWGDMRTLAGWWDVVTARLYWGYAFGLAWGDWPQRILAWLGLIVRQFTSVGAAVAVGGLGILWRRERRDAIGIVVTLVLVSLYAVAYATPDSLVYLVPMMPVAAMLLGTGLMRVVEKGVPAWALLLLPLALLVWNWRVTDLHADTAAVDWLQSTLAALPADAVLITEGDDGRLFALWYAQEALSTRRDVLVIDRNFWWQESYRQFLFAQIGRVVGEPEDFATERPLCRVTSEGVACP